jgi:hypothetical protein
MVEMKSKSGPVHRAAIAAAQHVSARSVGLLCVQIYLEVSCVRVLHSPARVVVLSSAPLDVL